MVWKMWPQVAELMSAEGVSRSRQQQQLICILNCFFFFFPFSFPSLILQLALLEDVEIFPSGHFFPFFDAKLIGNVVKTFDFVQESGHWKTSKLWKKGENDA